MAQERTAVLIGVPDASAALLARHWAVVDDVDDATVVVVSTRLGGEKVRSTTRDLVAAGHEVVVLTEAGSEVSAAAALSDGACRVVAEGREETLGGEAGEDILTPSFAARSGQRQRMRSGAVDPVTQLPEADTLRARLTELCAGDPLPRVVALRVGGLDEVASRLSEEAAAMLRRRLAGRASEIFVAINHRSEVFWAGADAFVVLAPGLTPDEAVRGAEEMIAVAGGFAPLVNRALGVAAGHAGEEVSSDADELLETALRAATVASDTELQSGVVPGEELPDVEPAAVELETTRQAVLRLETTGYAESGHAEAVSAMASAIADRLGFEDYDRDAIGLAGLLHDLGRVGRPLATDPEMLFGDERDAYEHHPARSAEALQASAGELVIAGVRGHHERWDGGGFPDGLKGDAIPWSARIVAAAELAVRWRERYGAADAVQRLRADDGAALAPDVASVAADLLESS